MVVSWRVCALATHHFPPPSPYSVVLQTQDLMLLPAPMPCQEEGGMFCPLQASGTKHITSLESLCSCSSAAPVLLPRDEQQL
ncbi:uncharacterized [Tachysurus ichikawai]